jgi:hypothetical protein
LFVFWTDDDARDSNGRSGNVLLSLADVLLDTTISARCAMYLLQWIESLVPVDGQQESRLLDSERHENTLMFISVVNIL